MTCQIGGALTSETGESQTKKRQRKTTAERPLSLATYRPTLSQAIQWCAAAWSEMPNFVIVNSWKKANILLVTFCEGEVTARCEMLEDADKVVAEDYSKTDLMLDEFREVFPHTMTAREYAEEFLGEDQGVQQPPTAKEFVEQVLQDSSSSEEESDEDEELISEEAFEAAFSIVEKFMHQKAETLGTKHVINVFLLKQAWKCRKIDLELSAKKGQRSIRDFYN